MGIAGFARGAHAAGGLLDCTVGSSTVTYTPGIKTGNPQTVQYDFKETLSLCVAPTDPTLTGGNMHVSGSITLNCDGVFSVAGSFTFSWDNGKKSTVEFTSQYTIPQPLGGVEVVQTGKVTAGFGEGDTYTQTFVYQSTDLLACESPQGLTTISGVTTLAFA
jgi:hypothetical protein